MKKSKGTNPCGYTESPAKAKSRIKRFEQHLECNHRLANTYANNQPGEVPKVPTQNQGFMPGYTEPKERTYPPSGSMSGIAIRSMNRRAYYNQLEETAKVEADRKKRGGGGGGGGY